VAVRIDIVLPCLDEAGALPWMLARIPHNCRAIVVDNGSTDRSAQLAADAGALVVTCARRGYGAACHTGLSAASADLVAFCDCDGSLDPAQLLRLADAVDGGADLVLGRRRPDSKAAWTVSSRIANKELARRVRRRTGARIHDVSPMRLARPKPLRSLDIQDRRSGYPVETLLRAADAGWRIAEVDIDYRERIGRSKVTGTVRGYLQAVRDTSAVLKK
jgi:glycosyltransferase involved in cell wall biosynthesis